jgi:alpha-L-arabinofuranosidase
MNGKLLLRCGLLLPCIASAVTVTIDADKTIAQIDRKNLLGINVAVYNPPEDFRKAVTGSLSNLQIGLVRIPGGSISDRYYWNGNGVIENGKADPAKFQKPFWQVDYSAYQSGFVFDRTDWSALDYGVTHIDARGMHEITRAHPVARNLVTVNAGTGTPDMAAEWVRWANIVNKWDVKYWEIGNELNGEWEAGHIRPDGSKMTAEKYAEIFTAFAKAMKAVDPAIKIGGPSCDIRHEEDYFEPLMKLAGDHVDFLTLHFYSLRDSLAPEKNLFDGLENLKPVIRRLDTLVKKYQPNRLGQIDYSITEWNSKLPKDQDAYRLFNGLWFSAWIGEMAKSGIDSATVWDLFSDNDNGHGMLVKQPGGYEPTGRYWAFWLWSHCMADTLVESAADNDQLHVYATRDTGNVYVMIMNESRTNAVPVELMLSGFDAKSGREITLSSREYFWNPVARRADWNSGPVTRAWNIADQIAIPPYCVKVYQFSAGSLQNPEALPAAGIPELRILLPENGFGDLEVEGWVRAFEKGAGRPFSGDLGSVKVSANNGASVRQIEPQLNGSAAKFILIPHGPGPVTVTAECGGLTAKQLVDFKPVQFEERVAWTFETHPEEMSSRLVPTCGNGRLQLILKNENVAPPGNHILAIKKYPREIPKERIGGVFFDLSVSKDFQPAETRLHVVLQSHGAYWIPCGEVSLKAGVSQTVRLEIPDKNFLKVMDQGFAVLFLLSADREVSGSLTLDNLGFLLRPANSRTTE